MSVNSSKITIYSSPQVEHVTTSSAAGPLAVNHVPKRTTYRVKISNSKHLEALSTAANLGLTSWVGGQKVRIVDVVQKDSAVVAQSRVSTSSVGDSVNGSLRASFAHSVPASQSVTHGIYSSGKSALHPVCAAASVAVTAATEPCSPSTYAGTARDHFVTHAAGSQSWRTSKSQSSLMLNRCQPLQAWADTGKSLRHCSNGSVNSLVKPWAHCDLVGHPSLLQGLRHFRVRYLGTVDVNSHTADSATAAENYSGTALHSQSLTELAVSAVKTVTAGLNGSSNNQLLYAPTDNNAWTTCSQPANQTLRSSQAISSRGIKRPYMDEERTSAVSPKRMTPSVTCVRDNGVSDATVSGTHHQPLTGKTWNNVAARLCDQYSRSSSDCSVSGTKQNCWQPTVEVNNNCSGHPMLSNPIPKLRQLLGSGATRYKDCKLYTSDTVHQHVTPSDNLSSTTSVLSSTDHNKECLPDVDESCARVRPYSCTRKKLNALNSFTFLLSRHRVSDVRLDDNFIGYNCKRRQELCDLPMAMRFRHLREFSHSTVTVHRSQIHGLGLFCIHDVSAGEMLMEYAGEVIRASVADVRERRYDSHGIGCYMFRCGDDDVIDATKCGNVARFINHSCEPNCYSRQIVIDGRLHIVILALHDIRCGDELTYDYKFPLEDVKMPCFCNSRRCRKFLN